MEDGRCPSTTRRLDPQAAHTRTSPTPARLKSELTGCCHQPFFRRASERGTCESVRGAKSRTPAHPRGACERATVPPHPTAPNKAACSGVAASGVLPHRRGVNLQLGWVALAGRFGFGTVMWCKRPVVWLVKHDTSTRRGPVSRAMDRRQAHPTALGSLPSGAEYTTRFCPFQAGDHRLQYSISWPRTS